MKLNALFRAERGARSRVLLGSVFLLVGAGCGGSTDAGPIGARDFPTTYAQAFCANLEACCKRFAFGYDEASCRNNVAIMIQMGLDETTGRGGTYDPEKARVCVATAAGYARTCTPSIEQNAAFNSACSAAFGNEPGSAAVGGGLGWTDDQTGIFYSANVCTGGSDADGAGTRQPGDRCSCSSDCEAPNSGAAQCVLWSTRSTDGVTQSGSLCQAVEPPADGDPCGETLGNPTAVERFETARRPVITECSTETDMFCEPSCGSGPACDPSQGGVCRHLPSAEERCNFMYQRARDLACVEGMCRTPTPAGAACVSAEECGFEASCARGICVPNGIAADEDSCGVALSPTNTGPFVGTGPAACPTGATMGCTCADGSFGTSICDGLGFRPCTCSGGALANCGNGVIDPGEMCDGTDLNGLSCASATMGAKPSGVLACAPNCMLDTSGCTS